MAENTETHDSALIRLGRAAQQDVNGHRFLVLDGEDGGTKIESLESLECRPYRARGSHSFTDMSSFIAFVNPIPKKTLFCNTELSIFTAIMNAHDDNGPGWGDWRATYGCPLSREWKIWTSKNGIRMSQEDFARFIEDNALDITRPESATMIEVSRSLEAKKTVSFAKSVRLDNGQSQLSYTEEIAGTSSKGQLTIPETFQITIPVYQHDEPYNIDVRLRYRIDGSKLMMWFELVRHQVMADDALKIMAEKISNELGTTVLNGTY